MSERAGSSPSQSSEQEERRLREAEHRRGLIEGATLHQFAVADAAIPRGRFAQVEATTVIGSKLDAAAAYPAASAAHQTELPPEPPLGFDNPALNESSAVLHVEATGDPVSDAPPRYETAQAESAATDSAAGSSPSLTRTKRKRKSTARGSR
jgi:hypothetical protein